MERQTVYDITIKLLEARKFQELKAILQEMNPADIAGIFEEAEEKDILLLYRLLPKELASETFAYIDSEQQEKLIMAFSDKEIRDVLDELFLDDTVAIIEEMPANVVSRILRNADSETRDKINELLHYPKDSAGSIMTPEYVYLDKGMTVKQSFEKIRKVGVVKETIYTCYVTEQRKLVGVVSILDLLTADPETHIADIMETNVISVGTHEDKETVAALFSKYDMLAIPVVDGENRIVGIVTVDDAIYVMQEETTEDIEKMAALVPSDKPYFRTGIFETFKKRIPWLMLLMISATFTGIIITSFEEKLSSMVVLTAFIPMLMDTGGNAGSQASVTVIRGLSVGDIRIKDIFRILWKEFRVSILCGVALAAANIVKMLLIDRLLLNNSDVTAPVAVVVSLTLVVAVFAAKLIGCSLPILAKKIGFDPAVMASPFITTLVDALSLIAYFQIASAFLIV